MGNFFDTFKSALPGVSANSVGQAGNGLIGLVGQAIGGHIQDKYAKKAFERETAYQNWLIQNQPSMQVLGLEKAGLAPAMANGQFNSLSAPSAPSASPSFPSVSGIDSSWASVGSQIEFLQEQKKSLELDNLAKKYKLPFVARLELANTEKAEEDVKELRELRPYKINHMLAQSNNLDSQTKQIVEKLPYEKKLLIVQADNFEADTDVKKKQLSVMAKQIELWDAEIRKLDEETRKLGFEIDQYLPILLDNLRQDLVNKRLDSKVIFNQGKIQHYLRKQLEEIPPETRTWLEQSGKLFDILTEIAKAGAMIYGARSFGKGGYNLGSSSSSTFVLE